MVLTADSVREVKREQHNVLSNKDADNTVRCTVDMLTAVTVGDYVFDADGYLSTEK